MAYHRLLTHRGYKTSKWIEYFLTICGTLALEGGPIFWVATHRIHHQHSDHDGDPHTPREGTFWAHMGWIITGKAMHHDTAGAAPLRAGPEQGHVPRVRSPRGTGCRRWSSASRCSPIGGMPVRAVGHVLPHDLRPARDVAGELGDAPVGLAPLPDPRRLHEQLVGGAARASARAGTTTTTPTRCRPATAWPGTSWTSTGSASARSRPLGLAWDVKVAKLSQELEEEAA